jgi:hypothetical protein
MKTNMPMEHRIVLALERLRAGHAPMRIPAEPSDADLVICDLHDALATKTAELAGTQQAESALRVERDALSWKNAELVKTTADLTELAQKACDGEVEACRDRDAARAEVARLTAVQLTLTAELTALTGDLEAERAGNALLSETVTTLVEQRDLCAAEAERMRAKVEACRPYLDTDHSRNDVDCRACKRLHDFDVALAAPSTAAQVLAERDERVRAKERKRHHECDRYELAYLHGVSFCRKDGATIVHDELTRLKAKLAEVTAERDKADGFAAANATKLRVVETALAASQAQVRELRAALVSVRLNGNYIDGGDIDVHDSRIDAALARESSTATLREFGLRVAVAVHEAEPRSISLPEIVEAVLRGDAA